MSQLLRVTGKRRNKIDSQISYNIKGSSFDPKAASLYSVALHAAGTEITLGISNPKSGDVLAVNAYVLDGKTELERLEKFLQDPTIFECFKNSTKNIYYSTNSKFTIIPSVFYDSTKLVELVSSVIELTENEKVNSTFIPEIEGYIAFSQDKEVTDFLKSKIGHIQIRHHFASLISTYHLYYAKEGIKSAFIQYQNKEFTLCLMDGKKMISFNAFTINSFEDVVYYTYYSMEQFGFSPADTEIHIGGDYEQHPEVLTAFQRYTATIFHLKPSCCMELENSKANALINTIFDIQCG